MTSVDPIVVAKGKASTRRGEPSSTNDMFGRGMAYSAIFAVQAVSSILITPAITRALGANQYGFVADILTIGALAMGFTGLSAQVGIQRHFADEEGDRETRSLITVVGAITIVLTIALVVSGPYWARAVGLHDEIRTLQYGLAWGGVFAVVNILTSVLRSQDRIHAVIFLATLQVIASQVTGLVLVFVLKRTAESYFFGMLLGQMMSLVLGVYLVKPWPMVIKSRQIIAIYAISLPLLLHAISVQILNLGDRVIVQRDLGSVAVARYQLAYNASAILMMILSMLNFAWEPRLFATKDPSGRRLILMGLRDGVFRLLAPSILAVLLATPAILRILAPHSYNTKSLFNVALIVTFSAIPFAWYASNIRRILMFRNTKSIIWVAPVCSLVNIGLNILFVPHIGIFGSALATLVAYSLLAVIVGILGRRYVVLPSIPTSIYVIMLAVIGLSISMLALPDNELTQVIRTLVALVCGWWAIVELRLLIRPNDGHKGKRRRYLGIRRTRPKHARTRN
jgi:O-antigen/teichoic acid export membrane protein